MEYIVTSVVKRVKVLIRC